jgi:hypothetical protein
MTETSQTKSKRDFDGSEKRHGVTTVVHVGKGEGYRDATVLIKLYNTHETSKDTAIPLGSTSNNEETQMAMMHLMECVL